MSLLGESIEIHPEEKKHFQQKIITWLCYLECFMGEKKSDLKQI